MAFALVALLGASGCDHVYFEYTDCQYYDGPRFDRISLSRPVLNQEYADQVRLYFDNDWHVGSYEYRLEFSGVLPPGIVLYENNRRVLFEGTATSQGVYSFSIATIARYRISGRHAYSNQRNYCSYRTVQNYQLAVRSL